MRKCFGLGHGSPPQSHGSPQSHVQEHRGTELLVWVSVRATELDKDSNISHCDENQSIIFLGGGYWVPEDLNQYGRIKDSLRRRMRHQVQIRVMVAYSFSRQEEMCDILKCHLISCFYLFVFFFFIFSTWHNLKSPGKRKISVDKMFLYIGL